MTEVNNFYVEQATIQTHTGDTDWTDISGTTITGASLAANTKYLIVAKYSIGISDNADSASLRIVTADDATVASKSETVEEAGSTSSSQGYFYLWAHSFSTDGTPADIKMQFKTSDATETVDADQLTLWLLDLDDLGSANYFEAIGSDDSVELGTSLTALVTIDGADLGTTEEWALIGYNRIGVGATDESHDSELRGANDAASTSRLSFHRREGEDVTDICVTGFVARHKAVTSNVDADIRAAEETGTANMLNRGSYLIAIKASAFEDFEFVHAAGPVTVPNTEADLVTITDYTPTTDGNHMVWGTLNMEADANPSRNELFLAKATATELFPGDRVYNAFNVNDPTDQPICIHSIRESLSGEETYKYRGDKVGGGANPTVENLWMLILSLELAAAPPPAALVVPRQQLTTVRM